MGVGALMGADDGAACGDGEHRLEGKAAGWPLLSSSHVEVVISSRQRRPGLVVGASHMRGGNSIIKILEPFLDRRGDNDHHLGRIARGRARMMCLRGRRTTLCKRTTMRAKRA